VRLRKATLYAIIGLIYIFVSRTLGTLFPEFLVKSTIIIRFHTIISFIASLALVFFYYCFYKNYSQKHLESFRLASKSALIGAFLTSLLYLKSSLRVFQVYNIHTPILNIFIPLISAFLILYFYYRFYKLDTLDLYYKLRFSILLVIISFIFTILMRFFVIFNYFYGVKLEWTWNYSQIMPLIFIPIIFFAFFTHLNFFINFYKKL